MQTISEILILRTIARLPNREKESLNGFLTTDADVHNKHGFNVTTIDTNLEFECIQESFSTPINLVDKDDHVCPIELQNITITERVRCSM